MEAWKRVESIFDKDSRLMSYVFTYWVLFAADPSIAYEPSMFRVRLNLAYTENEHAAPLLKLLCTGFGINREQIWSTSRSRTELPVKVLCVVRVSKHANKATLKVFEGGRESLLQRAWNQMVEVERSGGGISDTLMQRNKRIAKNERLLPPEWNNR